VWINTFFDSFYFHLQMIELQRMQHTR
jgi:hypothetical protein